MHHARSCVYPGNIRCHSTGQLVLLYRLGRRPNWHTDAARRILKRQLQAEAEFICDNHDRADGARGSELHELQRADCVQFLSLKCSKDQTIGHQNETSWLKYCAARVPLLWNNEFIHARLCGYAISFAKPTESIHGKVLRDTRSYARSRFSESWWSARPWSK